MPFIERKPRRSAELEKFYLMPNDKYAPLIIKFPFYVSLSGKFWSGYNDRRLMGNFMTNYSVL